jgi:hypothetical protein
VITDFKGDSIRLCLTYAGLPFRDVRSTDAGWSEFLEIKGKPWPSCHLTAFSPLFHHKQADFWVTFAATWPFNVMLAESGQLPFGQMPILRVGGPQGVVSSKKL